VGHGRGSLSHPGEYDLVGPPDLLGVAAEPCLVPQAFNGKGNALYVPGPIIQYHDLHHRLPLVDGNTISSASRFTAILMALAKALKMASILWCSFPPSALMFRLALAPSLKDLKKWRNISVGISPIFSRWKSASQTSQFLPPKSRATWARQSSMGRQKP